MKKENIKTAILRIEGTNCEQESYHAFKKLGTQPEMIHLKQLLQIDCNQDEKRKLSDYQCLMIPGGFSAGDYIRAGTILAARIKSKLKKQLKEFVEQEKPILGICNGFQVLIELGLLPGIKETMAEIPKACLHVNDSGRFECRPTLLKHENQGKCKFTKKIPKNKIKKIPSAHAEGKLIFPQKKQKQIIKKLEENDQIVFKYVDPQGEYLGYPWNPNGSPENIAGICNHTGTVFGMMPHPERSFYQYQHSDWTRQKTKKEIPGDGRPIFESIIEYIQKKF
ncbi:MAG: phosphoribosylformylglycinamidine synthase subunit PurQ [Candidatus Thermoplasmatota archaeon]